MNVRELKNKLEKLPDDMKVAAMNTVIEWDETCPGFGIIDSEVVDNGESEMFLSLQFTDKVYIKDDVNLALGKSSDEGGGLHLHSVSVSVAEILKPKYANTVFTWKQIEDAIKLATER